MKLWGRQNLANKLNTGKTTLHPYGYLNCIPQHVSQGHGTPDIPSTCSKQSAIPSHTDRFYSLLQGMSSALISSMYKKWQALPIAINIYSWLYWAIKIDQEKKPQAGRSLLTLTQKRKHPSFAAVITETKQLRPLCPSHGNWKAQGESKGFNTFGQFLSNLHSKSLLDCTWTSPPKKGTRRLKGKSHEMRKES